MIIITRLADGIASLFQRLSHAEKQPTLEEILGDFSLRLKDCAADVDSTTLSHEERYARSEDFKRGIHILLESSRNEDTDERHAEFREEVLKMLDETNETHPGVAIFAAHEIYQSGLWTGALLRAQSAREHIVPEYKAQLERQTVRLDALYDAATEKLKSLQMQHALKAPEAALNRYVGRYNLDETDITNEKYAPFHRMGISHALQRHYMNPGSIEALRSIDLAPYFEASPVQVLIASSILAQPKMNDQHEAARVVYNGFKERAKQLPQATTIGYFVDIIEQAMPPAPKTPVGDPDTLEF